MKWLIYGHKGWIGSYFCDFLKQKYSEIELIYPSSRADSIEGVAKDFDEYNPDHVISFIGRTNGPGFPNIDYLEQKGKLKENLNDNLFSPLLLMKFCSDRNIHFTYLGTGCIYSYENPADDSFGVDTPPNYFGTSYSCVKAFTDTISKLFPNTLNVRIRMPIVGYDHPKNLISKIIGYSKINNALNSVTVLDDAIPRLVDEIIKDTTGTINLVNPGPIDHVTILELYKKYVDSDHTYTLISEISLRANNTLVPSFDLPLTKDSIETFFQNGAFVKK